MRKIFVISQRHPKNRTIERTTTFIGKRTLFSFLPLTQSKQQQQQQYRFCESRFRGKCIRLLENSYLFAFGQYNPVDLTKSQIRECLRLRGLKGSLLLDTLKELQRKYRESTSTFNHLKPMRCCKYKCSLVHAILDSRRDRITTHEIGYFRWKLFYQNRPSSTGIRHFREDGVYVSRT